MNTRRFRMMATAGLLALGIGASTIPAGASTATTSVRSESVARMKARCSAEIQRRQFTLTIAKSWISGAHKLSDEQKASMTAGLDAVLDHLLNVNKPALDAATTRDAVKAACQAIILDNRVYVVVIPQLLLTVRAEQLLTGYDTLTTKSTEAAAAGKDVTTLNQQLADAKAKIDPALAAVAAVTPDSYNADHAGTEAIFSSARQDLQDAFVLILQAIHTYRSL